MSKKTPLHDIHTELGASFTDFAGWSMPLRYTSERAEHHAVRTTAGITDLTHMGEIALSGPEVGRALDHALVGEPSKIAVGRARYSLLVHETGGVLDNLLVHRLAEQRYLVVANAANAQIVLSQLRERIDGYAAAIRDASGEWALIAVQGPTSPAIVSELAGADVPALKYYAIAPTLLAYRDVLLARTGYTGQDGFEIYCSPRDAAAVWRAVSAAGTQHGLVPCGLACRDTLRAEAGMPLYGRELTVRTTPFDAGLGRVTAFGKLDGSVGEAALAARRDEAPTRVLAGLASTCPRAPRTGSAVFDPETGERIGEITSGALSPTGGDGLPAGRSGPGTNTLVDIRGSQQDAEASRFPTTAARPDHFTGERQIMSPTTDLKYTRDHEWIATDGDLSTVGVTGHAADALGDVVYLDLPAVGTTIKAGDACGEIESTKSVSDLFAPADGEVTEINEAAVAAPGLVNTDPFGTGWLFRMRITGTPDLMDATAYAALIEGA